MVAIRMQLVAAQLTQAATLRRLGKLEAARVLAEKALADALAAKLLPAVGEARQELGTILHADDDPGAEQMLVDGLTAAAEAHADLRAAQIAALSPRQSGRRDWRGPRSFAPAPIAGSMPWSSAASASRTSKRPSTRPRSSTTSAPRSFTARSERSTTSRSTSAPR